jgi:ABC-type nitrate/sulfonate/bicarbonate transport system permease component
VAVWEIATRSAANPFFPPPSTIAKAAGKLWFSGPPAHLYLADTVFHDIVPGVGRMLAGFGLAAAIGITAGVLLGRSATAMNYVGPLFGFMRSIPPPLLVPFFLPTLGLDYMSFGTIAFGAVWPILLNTVDGARRVDATKVDTARAFRLTRTQWLAGVVLPSAAPKVFAGLRVSLSISVILMVVSELVGSVNGIGNQLVLAKNGYDLPIMWAWIVLLGVLGYVFNTVLLVGERRALAWQPRHSLAAGG